MALWPQCSKYLFGFPEMVVLLIPAGIVLEFGKDGLGTTGSLNWINLFKRVEMNPILCAMVLGKHTNYTSIPV